MKIGKIKINKFWVVAIIIVVLIVGYNVLKAVFKSPIEGLLTEKIYKGKVIQEISETGQVRATQDISLGFKAGGRISAIFVTEGAKVKKGDVLAKLDAGSVAAQLQAAKAVLEAAKMKYDKLIAGQTQENIKPYEDAVESAQHDLDSAYEDALDVLQDTHIKIYNAYNEVLALQNDYFNSSDQEGIKVSTNRTDLLDNMRKTDNLLNYAESEKTAENINSAVVETLITLDKIKNNLRIIREQCDSGIYYSKVPSATKAAIDAQRGYINTAISNTTSAQQKINSYKIALQKAKDNLAAQTAGARIEDIEIYKSDINQAQANVDLYQSQLTDNFLKSPIDAKITKVNVKTGQVVSMSEPVVNLLSLEPFQIKANIYEQDIVNVKIGNEVRIELIAFPNQEFSGKVLLIDPAETIVENVVYYEVTIDFPNQPEGIRSGMTADITIKTDSKESVLRVSKGAVARIDGKESVQLFAGRKIINKEIKTGLEGNDYYEVLSGLKEGDIVVLGKK